MDNEEETEQIQETLQSSEDFKCINLVFLDPILIDPKKKQIKRQMNVKVIRCIRTINFIRPFNRLFLDALIAEKNIEDIKSIKSKQPDIIISKILKKLFGIYGL